MQIGTAQSSGNGWPQKSGKRRRVALSDGQVGGELRPAAGFVNGYRLVDSGRSAAPSPTQVRLWSPEESYSWSGTCALNPLEHRIK